MKTIHEIALCMVVAFVMLAPAVGLADDSGAAVAATVQTTGPGSEAEKAFNEADPGEEVGKAIGEAMESMDMGHAILVPIMGIIGVFIAPMLMIIIVCFLAFRHRERKEQRNHETIRLMIEKGVEIPPNLSFGDATPATGSSLNRGLICMGAGAGLIIFFLVLDATEVAGIGAIPLFIGLAYLLSWYLEKNKSGSADETGKAR